MKRRRETRTNWFEYPQYNRMFDRLISTGVPYTTAFKKTLDREDAYKKRRFDLK